MNSGRLVDLGCGRFAHASGALWMPESRTAVLADVHLGFGWALRRRGQLGPVDDKLTRRKLTTTVEELEPLTIVFLGDLVHAPRPATAEREAVAGALLSLRAQIVVVLGNHDRGFVRDYPELKVEVCKEWHAPGLVAVHGDKALPEGEHVLAGHLHPAVTVFDDAGSGHKMPAFVAGEKLTLLPAFSAMAAGFDVRAGVPPEVGVDPRIIVASGRRAVDLGRLSRLRTTR
jgi:metallophosphoesterase superfamily enzyme